jgi:quercetin dioxygenase-like cupin family protein
MSATASITNIDSRIDELMNTAGAAHSGRATHAFRAAPGGVVTQVLLVLKDGRELSEHENPGEALLHVLRGRVRLTAGDNAWELGPQDHLVIPQSRHGLLALEDSAVLLTIARPRS